MNEKIIDLAIVVPCFNEEEVILETAKRLKIKYQELVDQNLISERSRVFFVDDGSTDNTWDLINTIHEKDPDIFSGLKLSKNSGHQNALLCGLFSVRSEFDASISIDADLQDDISIFNEMITKYYEGNEIVYAVRSNRKTDTFFKRKTAESFYKVMKALGVDLVFNHADYRLIGKRGLNALSEYQEVNLFLRGIVPLLGYKTEKVFYTRHERFAGESKYSLKKMLSFSIQGITSFSIKPIRFITALGLIIFGISICMIIYSFIQHFSGSTEVGWSSLICSIWGIGGMQLFSLGVIGEYIGKMYLETKQRPRFNIESKVNK